MKRIWIAALTVLLVAGMAGAVSAQDMGPREAGIQAFYQESYKDAIPLFQQALQGDPRDTLALNYLLYCGFKTMSLPTIQQKFEQQAVDRSTDPVALAQVGIVYWFRGGALNDSSMMDEAANQFKEALKLDPNCSIAHCGLGLTYYQKRMMPRAKGHFLKAAQENPKDIMALERLGEILMDDDKKPDQSEDLFRRINESAPLYPDGHYYLGSALYDLGKYDDAVKELSRDVELDPHGISKGYDAAALIGDIYRKRKMFKDAISWYKKALDIRPDSEYVKYHLDELLNSDQAATDKKKGNK